jgi:hypothetical protein
LLSQIKETGELSNNSVSQLEKALEEYTADFLKK